MLFRSTLALLFAMTVSTMADTDIVVDDLESYANPAAWHAFGLLPEQHAFVEQLTRQQPCVLASLGTPEALHKYDDAKVKLCTFSDVPVSQRALAELVFSGASE